MAASRTGSVAVTDVGGCLHVRLIGAAHSTGSVCREHPCAARHLPRCSGAAAQRRSGMDRVVGSAPPDLRLGRRTRRERWARRARRRRARRRMSNGRSPAGARRAVPADAERRRAAPAFSTSTGRPGRACSASPHPRVRGRRGVGTRRVTLLAGARAATAGVRPASVLSRVVGRALARATVRSRKAFGEGARGCFGVGAGPDGGAPGTTPLRPPLAGPPLVWSNSSQPKASR